MLLKSKQKSTNFYFSNGRRDPYATQEVEVARLVNGFNVGGPRCPVERAANCNELMGCSICGLVQVLPGRNKGGSIHCLQCDAVLERFNGRSLDVALACAATTLLLLFPANLLPIFQVNILSASNHSLLASGAIGIWRQDWPLVALIIGLEIVLIPFLRFGLLVAVLAALRLGLKARWLGRAFRWSELLDPWAMVDVFLFGAIVGYARVNSVLPIRIETGGYCLIAAALFTLITRASLERREIWRRIGPVARQRRPAMISCTACDYPAPRELEGQHCPRCSAKLWRCHPYSAMRAMVLTAAAFVFYPAAYLYPMEYSDRLNDMVGYSIMTGVMKLVQANLWFFAGVVFVASIVIPLMKLFAFAWFGVSIHRGSNSRLRLKSRLYRIIDVIGRWSHIDPFTVAVFLPLMRLPDLLSVVVGRALPAFLVVVVLTMLASQVFDPRALWLAAKHRPQ